MPSMERRRESGNEASWNQEQQEWNNQYTLVKSATEPYSWFLHVWTSTSTCMMVSNSSYNPNCYRNFSLHEDQLCSQSKLQYVICVDQMLDESENDKTELRAYQRLDYSDNKLHTLCSSGRQHSAPPTFEPGGKRWTVISTIDDNTINSPLTMNLNCFAVCMYVNVCMYVCMYVLAARAQFHHCVS